MENTHKTSRLYVPISERSCVSPSLFCCRGPAAPFKAPLKPQRGLTSNCKEEGPAAAVKRGQADKFGLADFKKTLTALDDSSEIRWLTELLPLCLECQAFMSMGNQQGTKTKPNCHGYPDSRDTSPKSPRFQIPRKRRRRADGLVYAGTSQHNFKMTAGTPRVPPKARRLTKPLITSSLTFGDRDLEGDRPIICTPAARRKRAMGKERVSVLEERTRSPQELKPAWRVELPEASSANVSKRGLFSPRKDSSVREGCALPDSDSDLSEYDNDIHSAYITLTSLELTRKTEDDTRSAQKDQIAQAERDADRDKKAEDEEGKASEWRREEMGKTAAAQRVMGKIEEVEGIIRRVSLTSSDWIREGNARDVSDGCVGEEQHRCRTEFGSQLDTQKKGCNEDKPLIVLELHALGEALSQSLRQVLKMEGAKAESESFTEAKETSYKPNLIGCTRRPLNLSSLRYHFTSTAPNNSSPPSLLAGGGASAVPSLSLSTILDASQRTSNGFEGTSPILSPLFPSSQHSLPLSLADQHEEDISEHHTGWISSGDDSVFPRGAGGATTISGGTGSDQRNGRKTSAKANLRVNEQNQTQISRSTSETEASQDDLLSSGNNPAHPTTTTSYIHVIKHVIKKQLKLRVKVQS